MKERLSSYVAAVCDHRRGFSLAEVVVALGVISFAIVAILGVLPSGLQTSKSSQDETRAAQIARSILAGIASQAPTQFDNIQLAFSENSSAQFNLGSSETKTLYADNDGKIITDTNGATFKVDVTTNSAPTGFDSGNANQITVRVIWPANAPPASQSSRNYVRIISKF